ncbi:MAG TPA: hypothetical protein VHE79_05050, partial [Spirochaetia bacterium]
MTGETGRPREAGRLPSLLTRVLDLLPLGAAIMSFDAGLCYVNDALREMARGWHSELRPYEDGRVGSPEMERQLQEGAIAFFESEIRCER